MSRENKEKNAGTEIVKSKIFKLSSKTRYQTSIFLRGLKCTPTPKRNNIELKDEFFQNKEANNSEENFIQKQSIFISP